MTKVSKAFSPAGISSFFEICDGKNVKKAISPLETIGSRGGGIGIQKGIFTKVNISEAKKNEINVSINGRIDSEAETTRTVALRLLNKASTAYKVLISHRVEIPVGAGFGTSAGGALTTGLALAKALDLKLTFNEIGRIAHFAEIECKTGLGTVGPLMRGGCILTIEPGPPGTAVIDRIPLPPKYVVVAGVFGTTPTKTVLSSPLKLEAVNRWGKQTLKNILSEPSLENFLSCCHEFAEKTGFMTERVNKLIKAAVKAGAIGAAQNMVGEAVHSVSEVNNAEKVVETFKNVLPNDRIFVSKIDFQGARLIS